jgi:cardiolipin synthase
LSTQQHSLLITALPNLISLARLLAVPLAVWLILTDSYGIAFWVFVAAGVSDAIDGFIAKHFGARTVLGGYLDPLADKALLVSVYITLGYRGQIENWLVILVVFRDVLIIGGYLFIKLLDQPFRAQPLIISKINTGLQIALVALLLGQVGLGFGPHGLVTVLIWAVAATTVMSGTAYLVRYGRLLAGMEQEL